MSMFKKLKDVLFDVEDDELPVMEKERPVVDESPIKEVKMPKDEFEEIPPKKESNFNFPLDFEEEVIPKRREKEKYFDDEFDEKPRRTVEPVKKKEPVDYSYLNTMRSTKKEEKKSFTPSPVISPVYGILDHNYTKDDVIVKTDVGVKGPNLEEVRRKAYAKTKSVTPVQIEKVEEDELKEPLQTLDDIIMEDTNKKPKSGIVDEPLDEELLKEDELNESKEKIKTNNLDDTLENDLFNLIDSMYEDRKDEE